MTVLRALARSGMLCLFVGAIYAVWYAGNALLKRNTGRRRLWRVRLVRAWALGLRSIVGMRITVRGTPPVPPFLLVSNHLGYMDIVALLSVVDCVFVSRGDVDSWPVVGRLCRASDIIFIDRSRRVDVIQAGDRIGRAIENGDGVVLFAEGTSTKGADVGPFKSSLLEPAAARRLPVNFATIGYRTRTGDPPAHLAVCWWGDMTLPNHVFTLLGLRGFDATVTFSAEPVVESDRKVLAAKLHKAVSEHFEQVV